MDNSEIYEVFCPEEQEDEFWENVALSTAWVALWGEGRRYDGY